MINLCLDGKTANSGVPGWAEAVRSQHVCEVQVAHQTMLVARKGLPGHAIYGRVRNASELLEKMRMRAHERDATLRAARAAGESCERLARLGVPAPLLMRHFPLQELRAAP